MLTQKQPIADQINKLGERLMEESHGNEALVFLELAARQDPNNGQYANNLAIARFQTGDVNGAIEALETALELGGDRRLFVLNYADLSRTRPRLLRRGLEVCQEYLAQFGADHDVAAVAETIELEVAAADLEFQNAVTSMPEHAKLKVNGATESAHLVEMGQSIANKILGDLDGIAGARTVLDFGVGLGRVLWPLSQKLPSAQFIGFDVDPIMLTSLEGVKAVADTKFVFTTHDIPDNSVDAAYVVSVFTHLDHTAEYWLWELNRVLAPGGRAFVTFHDRTLFDEKCQQLGVNLTFTGHTTAPRAILRLAIPASCAVTAGPSMKIEPPELFAMTASSSRSQRSPTAKLFTETRWSTNCCISGSSSSKAGKLARLIPSPM